MNFIFHPLSFSLGQVGNKKLVGYQKFEKFKL